MATTPRYGPGSTLGGDGNGASFVNPYDGQTYFQNGIQWFTADGSPLKDQSGAIVPATQQQSFVQDAMAEGFSQQQYAGGGGQLTPSQLANLTANRLGEAEMNKIRDEQELTELQGTYDKIPDQLNTLYTNAAKKAGTFSGTQEFTAGLDSEVKQGTRGAQAALGSRLSALYSKLGRPAPSGLEMWKPGDAQATNTVNNTTDATLTPAADAGAPAAEPEASPEVEAPATTQNAVAKVGDTTLTAAQRKAALLRESQVS